MTRTELPPMRSANRTKSGGGVRMKRAVFAKVYPTKPERMVSFAQLVRKELIAAWSPGDRIAQEVLEYALSLCDFMEDCGRQGVVLVLPPNGDGPQKPRGRVTKRPD